MSTPVLEADLAISSVVKSAVNVFVKSEANGKVSAMVLGLPEYRVESRDRQSALISVFLVPIASTSHYPFELFIDFIIVPFVN